MSILWNVAFYSLFVVIGAGIYHTIRAVELIRQEKDR